MVQTLETQAQTTTLPGRLLDRLKTVVLGRRGVLGLSALGLIAGVVTYASLFDSAEPPTSLEDVPISLILFDLVVFALLAVGITLRAWSIWAAHRDGRAGAGLHMRLAMLFAAAAVIPALLISGFSMLFFEQRIEGWFSDRAQNAVSESVAVADTLIREHRATIRADVLAMAKDLNRVAPQVQGDSDLLTRLLVSQAGARGLSEAMVFDRSGTVLARTSLTFDSLADQIPIAAIEEADMGRVVSLPMESALSDTVLAANEKSSALVRLEGFLGAYRVYFYVARFVEPGVVAQVERAQQAAEEYQRLAAQRFSFQFTFITLFVAISVLLMLAAVWIAVNFSTRLTRRLGSVVDVAEKLRSGDMRARIASTSADDEIAMLGRAFNSMARQLEGQQEELVRTNQTLDERNNFMETVLAGVTAGVIGTDQNGIIDLPNRTAAALLGKTLQDMIGQPLAKAVPEMAELLQQSEGRPDRVAEGQIQIEVAGEKRTFFTRVGAERNKHDVLGYVVTFDDVTDLVAAQRTAVWADVARRIAHEIRNPLTPIQLSAERLRRRYLKQIEAPKDREIFQQCTDTIVRQVGDIGRMIEEFSSFARMPAPVMKVEDLKQIVQQSIFAVHVTFPAIEIRSQLPDEAVHVPCDQRQIGQVLTNVLNNACQSIEARVDPAETGVVLVKLDCRPDATVIYITDNGIGLPAAERERLTEPYVTTRDKGTGLGLAIVRKIMEDHSGVLQLGDNPDGGGARVTLTFEPMAEPAEDGTDRGNSCR